MTHTARMPNERTAKALADVNLGGRGLEVGPSYSPLVPKSSGRRIDTVDHAPREELVAKYRRFGLSAEKVGAIEEVDFVWGGGSLLNVVPERGVYDYIVASHFIEHSVDLLGFLQDCEALLAESGRLALIVPDKRFSFDFFKPLSSLGDIIDAHVRPTTFHPAGALIDHAAYATQRGGDLAWGQGDRRELRLQSPDLTAVPGLVAAGAEQAEYHDVHRWIFTPSSFRLLIEDLGALGMHGFEVAASHPTEGFEFFATLAKSGAQTPLSGEQRYEALRRIEAELDVGRRSSDSLEAENFRLSNEIAALKASTSWRLTKPLRAASAILRRR